MISFDVDKSDTLFDLPAVPVPGHATSNNINLTDWQQHRYNCAVHADCKNRTEKKKKKKKSKPTNCFSIFGFHFNAIILQSGIIWFDRK